jgi:hypothetical protein
MKVGDLVRVNGPILLNWYFGKTGVITSILRSEMNDDGAMSEIVTVMIGGSIEDFLPRYIEVIGGCR